MIEVGLRYAWIAAWLAGLGFVRVCLARLARGSPRLGWASARPLRYSGLQARFVSARTDPANCPRVVVAAEEFHEPWTVRCSTTG